MRLKIVQTNQGYDYREFRDLNGNRCTISRSSLATQSAIRFGIDNDFGGITRMHLSQDMLKELLPLLEDFAITGSIDRHEITSD